MFFKYHNRYGIFYYFIQRILRTAHTTHYLIVYFNLFYIESWKSQNEIYTLLNKLINVPLII